MFRPGDPSPVARGRAAAEGATRTHTERDDRSPSAAERARTLVEGNASAALTVPGCGPAPGAGVPAARAVLPDGDVLLLVAGGCPGARLASYAQDDDLAAVLEITDVAPVSVPHRVRGRAWVAGWLTPVGNSDRAACALLLAERCPVGGILGLPDASGNPGPAGPPSGDGSGSAAGPARPAWTLLRLEVGEVLVDDLWGGGARRAGRVRGGARRPPRGVRDRTAPAPGGGPRRPGPGPVLAVRRPQPPVRRAGPGRRYGRPPR